MIGGIVGKLVIPMRIYINSKEVYVDSQGVVAMLSILPCMLPYMQFEVGSTFLVS